jgi:hypothetical protein
MILKCYQIKLIYKIIILHYYYIYKYVKQIIIYFKLNYINNYIILYDILIFNQSPISIKTLTQYKYQVTCFDAGTSNPAIARFSCDFLGRVIRSPLVMTGIPFLCFILISSWGVS